MALAILCAADLPVMLDGMVVASNGAIALAVLAAGLLPAR